LVEGRPPEENIREKVGVGFATVRKRDSFQPRTFKLPGKELPAFKYRWQKKIGHSTHPEKWGHRKGAKGKNGWVAVHRERKRSEGGRRVTKANEGTKKNLGGEQGVD